MTAPHHKSGSVYQIAFLENDLSAAANKWRTLGAGPFYAFDDVVFADVEAPASGQSPKLSILLGYSGDTLIELIKVNEDPDGLFTGVAPGALHHIALLVDNIDDYLKGSPPENANMIFHARFPTGTPLAFLDTRPQIGVITELVTRDEMVSGMLVQMHQEAESFDGVDLIRTFG